MKSRSLKTFYGCHITPAIVNITNMVKGRSLESNEIKIVLLSLNYVFVGSFYGFNFRQLRGQTTLISISLLLLTLLTLQKCILICLNRIYSVYSDLYFTVIISLNWYIVFSIYTRLQSTEGN